MIRDRLKRAGVKIATPSRGSYDLADPSGNFAASVLAAAHAFEQDIRTDKMRAGLQRAAEAGYWTGGPPPYGYKIVDAPDGSRHKHLAINPDEADLLRRVGDMIVNRGMTTYSIAPVLNAEGSLTRGGKLWRYENLRWQLRHPRTKGVHVYQQDDAVIEVPIPAIFTEEEWDQIQAGIRGVSRPARRNRVYALTGRGPRRHLRCACGRGYFGKVDKSKKGRAYYQCSGDSHAFGEKRCGFRPRVIQAPRLDALVWEEVTRALTDETYLTSLAHEWLAVHLTGATTQEIERQAVVRALKDNREYRLRITRKLTEDDNLDDLGNQLAQYRNEEKVLLERQAELEQPNFAKIESGTLDEQIRRLVAEAKTWIADSSDEKKAKIFDVVQLDLVRVADDRFEGTASIPILDRGNNGEVSEGGPRLSTCRQQLCCRCVLLSLVDVVVRRVGHSTTSL